MQHLVREGRLPEHRRLRSETRHDPLTPSARIRAEDVRPPVRAGVALEGHPILDIAPTILSPADVKPQAEFDGVPIPLRGRAVPA